jgi:hypothetical protein
MLNDDVMDDIGNTVVDHDLIKGPSSVQSTDKSTVIVGAPSQPVSPQTTTQAGQALATAQVNFAALDGKTVKIVEMQAVHDEISTEGAVCRADVSYALEQFPALLGTRLTLEQFSVNKTKVNFDATVSNMKRSIAVEQALLFEDAKTFLKEPLEAAIATVSVLSGEHLPAIRATGNDLHVNGKDISSKLEGSKNTIVQYKEEFKSFLEIPVSELIPDMFKGGTMDGAEFTKAVLNIKTAYECRALKMCIATVIYGKPMDNLFSDENMRGETVHDLTFKDLLTFYTSEKYASLLESIGTCLNDIAGKLEFMKNSANIDTATPAELHNYLLAHNAELMRTIRASVSAASALYSLGQLNFNTHVLFEELKRA